MTPFCLHRTKVVHNLKIPNTSDASDGPVPRCRSSYSSYEQRTPSL
ncbi:hypothetical protein RSAG8_01478, partial [Rhizoctonia solani AG-8 WAC10335]